jgi:phosphocarrier protein HPr
VPAILKGGIFMSREIFTIKNTAGLHTSLATKIVQTANKYPVDINLIYKNKIVDLKSILGLMSLAIPEGTDVVLEVTGLRAEEALADLKTVFETV